MFTIIQWTKRLVGFVGVAAITATTKKATNFSTKLFRFNIIWSQKYENIVAYTAGISYTYTISAKNRLQIKNSSKWQTRGPTTRHKKMCFSLCLMVMFLNSLCGWLHFCSKLKHYFFVSTWFLLRFWRNSDIFVGKKNQHFTVGFKIRNIIVPHIWFTRTALLNLDLTMK